MNKYSEDRFPRHAVKAKKKKRKRKSFFRKLYHFVLIFAISLLVLTTAGIFMIYQKRDQLIQLFISEANKQINTPVEVSKVELSLFDKFPQLAIKFSQVNVKESINGSENPLATFSKVYFTFDVWQVLSKNYTIDHFYLEDGALNLKRLADGSINYQFLKENEQNKQQKDKKGQRVNFTVKNVDLDNVQIYYLDEVSDFYLHTLCHKLNSQLLVDGNDYHLDNKGDWTLKSVMIDQEQYANHQNFELISTITFNNEEKLLQIDDADIDMLDAVYQVQGNVNLKNDLLDLAIRSDKTNLESVVALLPEKLKKEYSAYRSRGDLFVNARLIGNYGEGKTPSVSMEFGGSGATFYHPTYDKSIRDVTFTGTFTNGNQRSAATYHLELDQVKGRFEGKPFTGALTIIDFNRYFVDLKLNADLDVNSFLQFYPIKSIASADGRMVANIDFAGYVKEMKSAKDLRKTRSSGEVMLQDVNFELVDFKLPFRQFNGSFIFKEDALAISDFTGSVGQSDFLLNGMFRNVMAYLFLKYQPIKIEADLESNFINLNELLSGQQKQQMSVATSGSTSGNYNFNISKRLEVAFNCRVEKLILKRFEGRNISGDLYLKKQKATSKNLKISTMGGQLAMNGYLDARNPTIEVFTNTSLKDIHLDSAFYTFNNFNQNFLQHHHLKGQATANVKTYLEMNHQLQLDTRRLISNIEVAIKNGALNNFEPMLKLSKYVDKDRLNRLRFSELKNEVLVHDRQVFLPQMEVGTNITTLEVNGTHSFDQEIDYHVRIPIKKYRVQKSKFGPIEEDNEGNLNMFLKIQGTTDDYRIVYDTKAWKKNFDENLKDEGQELKQAFKNKGKVKEKKSKELNQEEAFEWDQ